MKKYYIFISLLAQLFHIGLILNPKIPGGGADSIHWSGDRCHFSQDHTMITKILDFIQLEGSQVYFYYLDRFFRNLAETTKNLGFFGIENHKIGFFSNFL